jgi:hypothetical protein
MTQVISNLNSFFNNVILVKHRNISFLMRKPANERTDLGTK